MPDSIVHQAVPTSEVVTAVPARPTLQARARAAVEATGEELGLSDRQVLVVFLLPALVIVPVVVGAVVSQDVYKTLIAEDGPVEWAQVALLLGAAVLAAVLARGHRHDGRSGVAAVVVLMAVALVVIAGEEISWGQRLLGLETPEVLLEMNRQEEITLHNLRGVEDLFRLAVLAIGLFGAIGSFVLRRPRWRARAPHLVDAFVPHPVFAPAFAAIAGWRLYRSLFPAPAGYEFAVGEFAEVMELVFGITIVLFLAFQLRRDRTRAG